MATHYNTQASNQVISPQQGTDHVFHLSPFPNSLYGNTISPIYAPSHHPAFTSNLLDPFTLVDGAGNLGYEGDLGEDSKDAKLDMSMLQSQETETTNIHYIEDVVAVWRQCNRTPRLPSNSHVPASATQVVFSEHESMQPPDFGSQSNRPVQPSQPRPQISSMMEGWWLQYVNDICKLGKTNNFAHPLLASLVVDFFYGGNKSIRKQFPEVFSMKVPRVAITIAATMLKVILDEIVSSQCKINFRIAMYLLWWCTASFVTGYPWTTWTEEGSGHVIVLRTEERAREGKGKGKVARWVREVTRPCEGQDKSKGTSSLCRANGWDSLTSDNQPMSCVVFTCQKSQVPKD
ncbi:hypothetical protein OG21DRAFT_1527824 [Imleria badia]|nr:hypothetical protein OG21DRAFT_1527824 [Imleria badia]